MQSFWWKSVVPSLSGKESQHTLQPCPLPVHTTGFIWKSSSFIFFLDPCASEVVDSLTPRTEFVKTNVSYNKISGWSSKVSIWGEVGKEACPVSSFLENNLLALAY